MSIGSVHAWASNMVPYDKFRPKNEDRAYEFIYMLSNFAPERVKFGDKKSLKGQELYNQKNGIDPGDRHCTFCCDGDGFWEHPLNHQVLRNRQKNNPQLVRIRNTTNDSEMFLFDVEAAIRDGFLCHRKVLVLTCPNTARTTPPS